MYKTLAHKRRHKHEGHLLTEFLEDHLSHISPEPCHSGCRDPSATACCQGKHPATCRICPSALGFVVSAKQDVKPKGRKRSLAGPFRRASCLLVELDSSVRIYRLMTAAGSYFVG